METGNKRQDAHRCGVVAMVGRPNVGKSTMLNRLLGAKVSIVTPKPQTTRDSILGVLTLPAAQVLFRDTPGIHVARKALNRRMMDQARSAILDADALLLVTDPMDPARAVGEDADCLKRCEGTPAVLAINKIDTVDKRKLLPLIDVYSAAFPFKAIVPVCALTGDGLERVIAELSAMLPQGPALYADDDLSDRPLRFLAAEVIREKLTILTHQEVPYSAAVTIDEFVEPQGHLAVRISATIHVERSSQKAIVIGRGGAALKAIGTAARNELEEMLEHKVLLKLFVRVDDDWTRSERGLGRVGY